MTRLMIVVGSVRPGRIGLPIAQWVRERAEAHPGIEVDWADLAEIALPFLDEPAHPAKRQYTKPHTFAWSERVDAAEAFVFVTPEYNHSFAPSVKNALDFLYQEWRRKLIGFVSYGGVSAGSRGVSALESTVATLGMVRAFANPELPFAAKQVAEGVFTPTERQDAALQALLEEVAAGL